MIILMFNSSSSQSHSLEIDWSLMISALAFLASIILPIILQIWNNKRQDKKDKEQEEFQKNAQVKLEEFQKFQSEFVQYQQRVNELQFSIENRSDLIPYFHLNRTKSGIKYNKAKQLYVEIYLTNVGRGTATNITTYPILEDTDKDPIYFITVPRLTNKITHGFHDYFSENFALPNQSIKLEIYELEHNEYQKYFLKFKIKFSDVIGREYEQEFQFGYDNQFVKGINQNSTSYPPKLIKDIN